MSYRYLKLAESFIKEAAETFIRKCKTFFFKKKNQGVLSALNKDGLCVKTNALTADECDFMIHEIDRLLESESVNVWQDEQGADQRIYFAEAVSEQFKKLFNDSVSREILKEYTGTTNPVGFVLASRISYTKDNRGSGGGWHRDSPYTHQFKSIYFLNDVNEDNGPFQYIRGSHKKTRVLLSYLKKIFNPGQYRFSCSQIEAYQIEFKTPVESLVCDSGTLVYADTKGIHRGKPLSSGRRYAIFCYYWDKKIPKHFGSLKQDLG